MFAAAANAVSSLVTVRQPGASLLPHIDDLRERFRYGRRRSGGSRRCRRAGAGEDLHDIVQQVQDAMWQPEYRRIVAI